MSRKRDHAMGVMHRIGRSLIAEKKSAVRADMAQKGRGVEKQDMGDRDLLTLLIKANMATDVPESQRLTDDEVLARKFTDSLSLIDINKTYCDFNRGSNVSCS